MKQNLIAACLAGACTTTALAQSNVTLFGIADAAARSVSNSGRGSIKSLVSGSNSTSRIGFRGTEDMGGGLSAGFHLEHGITLDTGADASSAQFFDRRSTVSLASKTWGELRLGRDYTPTYSAWTRHDPFSYVGVAGSNNLVSATPTGAIRSAFGSNPNTTVRANNALQYFLPSDVAGLDGVDGSLMLAAGEGGLVANGVAKTIAARLGYGAGPVYISAATAISENSLTGLGDFKDNTVGASYNAGVARVSMAWRQFKQASAKQSNLLLGVVVPVGLGEIKLSWNRADMDGKVGSLSISANDATQLGLGYVHNLPKRTAVYATSSRIANTGAATFVVPGGPAGLLGGGSSTGYEAGVRHTF